MLIITVNPLFSWTLVTSETVQEEEEAFPVWGLSPGWVLPGIPDKCVFSVQVAPSS